jgi:hypothetical protein
MINKRLLIGIGTTKIGVVGKLKQIYLRIWWKLILIADKNILDRSVIEYASRQGPGTSGLEPVGAVLFMQPQNTPTGIVCLFCVSSGF